MKILEGRTGTGFTVKGEAVMLDKYGDVYPVIDNVMHPNPGTKSDGYSEIERTIDWLYSINATRVKKLLDEWVKIRVAFEMDYDPEESENEIIKNVMYSDLYDPCQAAVESVKKSIQVLKYRPDVFNDILSDSSRELEVAEKIVMYLNENFLRVRAGGKLNPEGANAIYFRISSHGYDWHRVIVDFLWNTFGSPDKMPMRVWIGHDKETNPPETILFDVTPQELFDKFDDKIFESDMGFRKSYRDEVVKSSINYDRACYKMNRYHFECYRLRKIYYRSFK